MEESWYQSVKMLFVLVLGLCVICCSAEPIVTLTNLGDLRGTTGTTYFTNKEIYKFLGVPYAEPMNNTSNNRFMRPEKKTGWSDTLDATEHGRICPQLSMTGSLRNVFIDDALVRSTSSSLDNDEDCLFLDIHTPQINGSGLPVLFYIHGGAFIAGSSRSVTPEFLLEHDIVLVAPQYRLGPLGFLNLDTNQKTANAALYDLQMALEFVYDNIEQFGGDPNNITVGGTSAGAASAAFLHTSPLTYDLVSKVILSSGSAIAPWVLDTEPSKHGRSIGGLLNCNIGNATDDEILLCLQSNVTATDLMRAYFQYSLNERKNGGHGMGGAIPVIDGDFLTEPPLATLSNDSFSGIPMLITSTKHEGIFLTETLMEYYLKPNNLINNAEVLRHDIAAILMGFAAMTDPAHIVASALTETYFNPATLGDLDEMTPGIVDFNGAAYFKGPALKTAELNSLRNGSTFLAMFSYDSDGSGVDHSEDQRFVFYSNRSTYSESDLAIVKRLTKLYAQFVSEGTPTGAASTQLEGVNWHPYSREENHYLTIDNELEMRQNFQQEFAITEIARRRASSSANIQLSQPLILLVIAAMVYQRLC